MQTSTRRTRKETSFGRPDRPARRRLARQGEAPRGRRKRRDSLEQCPANPRKRGGRRERGEVPSERMEERSSTWTPDTVRRESTKVSRARMGFRKGGRHLDRFEAVSFREEAVDGGLGQRRSRVAGALQPARPHDAGDPGAREKRRGGELSSFATEPFAHVLSARSSTSCVGLGPRRARRRTARRSPGIPVRSRRRGRKVTQARAGHASVIHVRSHRSPRASVGSDAAEGTAVLL